MDDTVFDIIRIVRNEDGTETRTLLDSVQVDDHIFTSLMLSDVYKDGNVAYYWHVEGKMFNEIKLEGN